MGPTKTCPQCNKVLNGPATRLVRDSCGHEKCRHCLLLDEERCQQCVMSKEATNTVVKNGTTVKCEKQNRTGVIICNNNTNNNGQKEKPAATTTVVRPPPKKLKITCSNNNNNNFNRTYSAGSSSVTSEAVVNGRRSANNLTVNSSNNRNCLPSHITMLVANPIQYKCNICCKQFTSSSRVKYHLYCVGGEKPFRCQFCSKDFVTKTQLSAHCVCHIDQKSYVCKVCSKSFPDRNKLKRHMVMHSMLKPFVCTKCGKAFSRNGSLKLHTLIHRGEKPFSCNVCSARFTNTSNLKKHLTSHSDDKVYMCDECGSTFKLKWTLTVHRRIHLPTRPYQCNECCISFTHKKELQRHQLIHIETKSFSCNYCTTSFRRKDSLYRHVRNTHPDRTPQFCKETVTQLLTKASSVTASCVKSESRRPVDNPNAIHVITASPMSSKPPAVNRRMDARTCMNGPLKLAFKTSAFRNHYNINRVGEIDQKVTKVYDMNETASICQKILSPHISVSTEQQQHQEQQQPQQLQPLPPSQQPPTTTEICQKILSPYSTPSSQSIHYDPTCDFSKIDIVKNIKFKLPANYANLLNDGNGPISKPTPLKSTSTATSNISSEPTDKNNCRILTDAESNKTFQQLHNVPVSNACTTSVIVNGNSGVVHWRRRTLDTINMQNF